mmetsp:Transcript_8206/g.21734  ORF Transcript_8206/g.21734 Transcript_8206/m.21734 type:complete len:567 (+) Transcript_8206:74-1774(+)
MSNHKFLSLVSLALQLITVVCGCLFASLFRRCVGVVGGGIAVSLLSLGLTVFHLLLAATLALTLGGFGAIRLRLRRVGIRRVDIRRILLLLISLRLWRRRRRLSFVQQFHFLAQLLATLVDHLRREHELVRRFERILLFVHIREVLLVRLELVRRHLDLLRLEVRLERRHFLELRARLLHECQRLLHRLRSSRQLASAEHDRFGEVLQLGLFCIVHISLNAVAVAVQPVLGVHELRTDILARLLGAHELHLFVSQLSACAQDERLERILCSLPPLLGRLTLVDVLQALVRLTELLLAQRRVRVIEVRHVELHGHPPRLKLLHRLVLDRRRLRLLGLLRLLRFCRVSVRRVVIRRRIDIRRVVRVRCHHVVILRGGVRGIVISRVGVSRICRVHRLVANDGHADFRNVLGIERRLRLFDEEHSGRVELQRHGNLRERGDVVLVRGGCEVLDAGHVETRDVGSAECARVREAGVNSSGQRACLAPVVHQHVDGVHGHVGERQESAARQALECGQHRFRPRSILILARGGCRLRRLFALFGCLHHRLDVCGELHLEHRGVRESELAHAE